MKRIVSVLLAAALIVAFAGCGGSEAANENENGSEYNGAGVVAPDSVLSFETTDLDGNKVSSENLFAEHDITMLNVWGTYCGPCIEEMPAIEELSRKYAEQGACVVGVVCDVPEEDDSYLQDAHEIVQQTGVTYQSVRWNDAFESQLNVSAIPTTIFVDSAGKVLTEPIVGASPDSYEAVLQEYLGEGK